MGRGMARKVGTQREYAGIRSIVFDTLIDLFELGFSSTISQRGRNIWCSDH